MNDKDNKDMNNSA
jgi:hypothetical protein